MNEHDRALNFIRWALSEKAETETPTSQSVKYHGTTSQTLGIKMGPLREVAKAFKSDFSSLEFAPFIDLLGELYKSDLFENKIVASLLLASYRKHLEKIEPKQLDVWLETLEGWAAVDNLCQSMFGEKLVNAQWPAFQKTLRAFSKSENISKRRASLVLLLKTFREGGDARHVAFNIETLELLKSERDILITKAVSWSLRAMVKHHRDDVERYVNANEKSLPAIAVRETRRKLATGRKW